MTYLIALLLSSTLVSHQTSVAQCNAAFHVQLQQMKHDSCSYRGRVGGIFIFPCFKNFRAADPFGSNGLNDPYA